MENNKTKKSDKKLIIELGTVIIVLFIITILINGYAIYYGSSYRFQERQKSAAEMILNSLNLTFEDTYDEDDVNLPFKWFVDFWHKNYKDMDLNSQSFKELWDKTREICARYDCFSPTDIDEDIINALPYEEQLILARYEYLFDSSVYNADWSYEVMDVKGYILRAFILDKDDTGFVIFETDPEFLRKVMDNTDENLKPVYYLGKTISFDLDDHPYAKKALETGKFQTVPEREFSIEDNRATLNYYMPIVEDGNKIGLVQLSLDWTENARIIIRNSAQIELVNLIALLVVAALILFVVYLLAVRPLLTVQQNVREYKENKDSEAIVNKTNNLHYRNEFGMLAADVADLAEEMNRYTEDVRRLSGEQEKKNTELSIARQIQMQNLPNVFPAFPDRKDFDIYAAMVPAREVGGDFYDYFLIDDDHLALVIADVSDKGVPAALFMMMAKTRLNGITMSGGMLSPAEILKRTNDYLSSNNDSSMFVTVWLGILTLSTGELLTSNGGHEDPFIMSDGEFSLYSEEHDLALGIMAGREYSINRRNLKKGDMIFVYTDGVPEAFDEKEDQFGMERLLDTLNRNRDRSVKDMITAVNTAVNAHVSSETASDDITMLALKLI